jgi:NADH:ubiquinone oxidoreductase subunit 3 (subunit A)
MVTELLSSPITVFVASLIVSVTIYVLGAVLAPKGKPSKWKLIPYACGEDIPPEKHAVSIHLFKYASLFMIFDAVTIVLAFSLAIKGYLIVLLSVAYCIPILIALLLLARKED